MTLKITIIERCCLASRSLHHAMVMVAKGRKSVNIDVYTNKTVEKADEIKAYEIGQSNCSLIFLVRILKREILNVYSVYPN